MTFYSLLNEIRKLYEMKKLIYKKIIIIKINFQVRLIELTAEKLKLCIKYKCIIRTVEEEIPLS